MHFQEETPSPCTHRVENCLSTVYGSCIIAGMQECLLLAGAQVVSRAFFFLMINSIRGNLLSTATNCGLQGGVDACCRLSCAFSALAD